jgi:hypothetical protein
VKELDPFRVNGFASVERRKVSGLPGTPVSNTDYGATTRNQSRMTVRTLSVSPSGMAVM